MYAAAEKVKGWSPLLFDFYGDGINAHYLLALQLSQGSVEAFNFHKMNGSIRPKLDKIDDVPYVPGKMKRSLSQKEKHFPVVLPELQSSVVRSLFL